MPVTLLPAEQKTSGPIHLLLLATHHGGVEDLKQSIPVQLASPSAHPSYFPAVLGRGCPSEKEKEMLLLFPSPELHRVNELKGPVTSRIENHLVNVKHRTSPATGKGVCQV